VSFNTGNPASRPPNDVTTIAPCIDTRSDLAGGRTKTHGMPKQQVRSTRTCAMALCRRQAITVCLPPISRFQVFGVDIEDVKIGDGACCDANQRRRILPPQFAQTALFSLRLLETVRRRWALIYQAWKAEQPIRSQRQRGVERRLMVRGDHELASVFSCVPGVGIFVVAADVVVASACSVTALTWTFGVLPRLAGPQQCY
jgi:hypothetical protein